VSANGRYVRLAAASVLAGSLCAYGLPAFAAGSGSVPITFSSSAGCTSCRTLVLSNSDGTSLTTLDLSSGSGGFVADVEDTGIAPAALGNFDVESTMSNLYKTTTSGFDCNTFIPSGDVSLTSLPGLLDAHGLGATVQPIFSLSGSLGTVLAPVTTVLGLTVPTTTSVTGVLPSGTDPTTTLTQTLEAAPDTLTNLTGSILNSGALPIKLTSGTGGAFTNPAAPPATSGCTPPVNAATPQPVLHGLLNGVLPSLTTPLLGVVQGLVGNPSLSTLIANNVIDAATAETLVSQVTGISTADLNLTTGPFAGLLTSIENTLVATVTGVVDSATTLTGTYGADPAMAISAPSATPATYQGVLTVTLTSGT
jgi:hypothetical protein